MRMVPGLSLMRSPLGKHSVQLSSSTVFMFSIQIASTGPSNTTHFLSGVVSATALRMSVLPSPSVHSLVIRLYSPYSSPILMHLGLNTYVWITWKFSFSWPFRRSFVSADCSIRYTVVLPPPVGPTSIAPKRTLNVSYICTTFSTNLSTFCNSCSSRLSMIARARSPCSTSGTSTPGNRSETIASKSSASSLRNLGKLESRIARINTTCSSRSGEPRLSEPAMTSTDLSARMPKS